MRVGLGTGSTAAHMIRGLGSRIRDGLELAGVATSSHASRTLAETEGIHVTPLEDLGELDLYLDGADEIDPHLDLIKGGGGALLHEKILAASSRRFVVIADVSKRVGRLGEFGVPIEVITTARALVLRRLEEQGARATVRMNGSVPVQTDEGNLLIDAHFGLLDDPATVGRALKEIPGIVEHGLFIGMTSEALLAGREGLEVIRQGDEPPRHDATRGPRGKGRAKPTD